MKIEFKPDLDKNELNFMVNQFEKYGSKFEVEVNYHDYHFISKENNKIIGILKGYFYYDEGKITKLIVSEDHRGKGVGTSLMMKAEEYLRSQNLRFMSLSTYDFQAPEFYKKLGFNIEFIRDNKEFPSLKKYFLIKYFR